MEKKELERKLRMLVIFTDGDGQGQATNTTLEEELGEYAMQKVLDIFSQELSKAREEGFDSGVEKTVNIIQEGLDELLLEKDGEKYWVGDILRDCGSSVEKILPQNMKHYLLSKLNKQKSEDT